jgi:porin
MLAAGTMALGASSPTWAEDAPSNGVPEESIAKNWNDPVRAAFARYGVTYGINYTGEVYDTVSGGFSRGTTYNGLIEGVFDVDLQKLAGWKGLTFHTNVYYIHGEGPTAEHIGALFPVSNLEAEEAFRLDEIWFEQSFWDDKLKIRMGSLAADTEFFLSDTAGHFLNGTFGWAGIFALDQTGGGPAYPLASLGARVAYAPNDKLTILAAIFNGSPANPDADDPQQANRHGTEFRLGDGALLMAEAQYKYKLGLEGTLKVGGWKQTNDDFHDYRAGIDNVRGNYGMYFIVDQQIWKGADDKSINAFVRYSGSPERKNQMDDYVDTGIVFSGFVPGRAKDSFGAAFGYGHISDDFSAASPTGPLGGEVFPTYESVLEVNYTAQIAPGFVIIPDFQYFWNPGGKVAESDTSSRVIDHAAVFGARTKISY